MKSSRFSNEMGVINEVELYMYAYERCIDKKKSHGAALQHHDFVECF